MCETGNAPTPHFVPSRAATPTNCDSGHLCLGGKIPQNATVRKGDASVAGGENGGGYVSRITSSGTGPLQLAQCAVEESRHRSVCKHTLTAIKHTHKHSFTYEGKPIKSHAEKAASLRIMNLHVRVFPSPCSLV